MNILVFGPEARYSCYRPSFASDPDAKLTFVPADLSPMEAARLHPDTEVIFADPITDLTDPLYQLLPRLRLVQSEGAAFNRFEPEAAKKRGVFVCNCKGCNASSVAEHTVMLMLMALRFGITGHRAVLDGEQYEMKQRVMGSDAPELGDCAVGLIGFGDIARETARRLLPFDCRLFYYSLHRKSPETEQAFHMTWLPLEELVSVCDVISLHCAVNEQTRGMVNKTLLSKFRPGSILVNTARGELIDNQAVLSALTEGRLGGIAMDTIAPEPTPADHPLVALPPELRGRAIYSPHLGGNTGGAFRRAHETMWNNVRLIRTGKRPDHIVNGL